MRLRDIGDELTWPELRAFLENLEPGPGSALFRAQYPKTWWWTPEMDLMAAEVHALEIGNWQRGGGKGPRPKPIKRPKETRRKSSRKSDPANRDELLARRQALRDEIVRRKGGVTHGD